MKENAQKIKEKLKEFFKTQPNVQIAYIYGSFLKKGFPRDLDIAVVTEETPPEKELRLELKLGREAEKAINHKYTVDLRIINQAPPHFKFEIIEKGEPIFVREKAFLIEFEAHVISEYQDYQSTLEFLTSSFLGKT